MYLNLIQIAESLGVSEKTITDWVEKEGMPHIHDRGRILFERLEIMEWAAKHGLAAHTGFLSEPATTQALSLPDLLRRGGIWRLNRPEDLPQTYSQIVDKLPGLPPSIKTMLTERLKNPQSVTLTPVGHGFALPHPSMRLSLGEPSSLIALIFLATPLLTDEIPDEVPITRLLFFISPTPRVHTTMLGLMTKSIVAGSFDTILPYESDDVIIRKIEQAWTTWQEQVQ